MGRLSSSVGVLLLYSGGVVVYLRISCSCLVYCGDLCALVCLLYCVVELL